MTDQVDIAALADELEEQAQQLRQRADQAKQRVEESDDGSEGFINEIAEPLIRLRKVAGLPDKDVKESLRRGRR